MADTAAHQSETLQKVRALLGSGKKISSCVAQELTLALLADAIEAQQKDREQIDYIKKLSIGVFIDRHRVIATLIAVLIIVVLAFIPSGGAIIVKALGLPVP